LLPAFMMIPQMERGHGIAFDDLVQARGWAHPSQLWSLLMPGLATAASMFDTPDITLRDFGLGVVPVFLAIVAALRPRVGRVLLLVAIVVCADLLLGPRSFLL